MAVHVPLSMEAQLEAQVLMLSANNILSPPTARPIAVPTQDMVLGIYYLTKERLTTPEHPVRGEGRLFSDAEEVRIAYDNEDVDLQARIRLRWKRRVVETTVGRDPLQRDRAGGAALREPGAQEEGAHRRSSAAATNQLGNEATVHFLDELKDLGFRYATLSGLSIGIDDMHIPSSKEQLIEQAPGSRSTRSSSSTRTASSPNGERYNKVVDIWAHVTEQIAEEMFKELEAASRAASSTRST